jgi:hypothetical protein
VANFATCHWGCHCLKKLKKQYTCHCCLRRCKGSEGVQWTILQELAKTAKCPKKPFFWRDLQGLFAKAAVPLP